MEAPHKKHRPHIKVGKNEGKRTGIMFCNDLADYLNSHRSHHHRRSPIRAFTSSDNNDQIGMTKCV